MWNNSLKKNTKTKTRKETKLNKTMAMPVVLYGRETWILSKKLRRNISSTKMKFLTASRVAR